MVGAKSWLGYSFDPWRVFLKHRNSGVLMACPCLYSFSIFSPTHLFALNFPQLHSSVYTTTICRLPPLWELLNISSHLWSQTAHFLRKLRSGRCWRSGRGKGKQETSKETRQTRQKQDAEKNEKRKYNKELSWSGGGCIFQQLVRQQHPLPFLSVSTAWPPATPAVVPFPSPQAHSAGFAW